MPLGDIVVSLSSDIPKRGMFGFQVKHPHYGKCALKLAVPSPIERDDWVNTLQQQAKCTWENAMLGKLQYS